MLTKLEWYRKGGEVSDRQWRDVLGVLKVQRGKLDVAYLRQWATALGVSDLLENALQQAAAPSCTAMNSTNGGFGIRLPLRSRDKMDAKSNLKPSMW